MAVYDETERKQWIAFHTSPDLKTWTFASRIEGFFECPDLFELPVEAIRRTIEVGPVRGRRQVPGRRRSTARSSSQDVKGKQQLWYGNFYAAQTFDNAPDGRRIQIGWAQGVTFPGMPFNQQMTIPVSLSLRKTGDDIRLHAEPVDYLETLEGERMGRDAVPLAKQAVTVLDGMETGRVRLVIHAPATGSARFRLRGLDMKYDRAKAMLTCGNVTVPLKASDEGVVGLECLPRPRVGRSLRPEWVRRDFGGPHCPRQGPHPHRGWGWRHRRYGMAADEGGMEMKRGSRPDSDSVADVGPHAQFGILTEMKCNKYWRPNDLERSQPLHFKWQPYCLKMLRVGPSAVSFHPRPAVTAALPPAAAFV